MLFTDEYLRFDESGIDLQARRYFMILLKLPMELQMAICNRLFGINKAFISAKLINLELKWMIKNREL